MGGDLKNLYYAFFSEGYLSLGGNLKCNGVNFYLLYS